MPSPPPVKDMSVAELLSAREYYQTRHQLGPKQVDRLIEIEGELSKRGDEVRAETLKPSYRWDEQ